MFFGEMNQEKTIKDFDSLQGEIQRRFETLSPHLKRIAEYALADPNRFALQTVATTAQAIQVQPSTLVRFAKLFDYSGFSELQKVFRARLTEAADNFRHQVGEHRIVLGEADSRNPATILHALADASVLAIDRLKHDLEADTLRRALRMLEKARFICVLGQRQAFPIAASLSLGLLKLGRRCQLLDSGAGMLPQHIANLTPDDLLVAVGLAEFSRTVLETIPQARRRGVPVLAISNSQTNPLARNSSLSLVVRDPEMHRFEPLAPYIVLAQTLVVALAMTREGAPGVDGGRGGGDP